ncbi:lantibiotic immunity ABC transporter MutE/EpiE family permease subunit [Alicyclobacillus sendaiensis]|uniref:lantibiotic immunity ABC transporter MutE/EpiE family permease subunit n=1 Tax=Alicyclobacillus sendaiensis TaxID=192387 RepID=UPI0026F451A0|nr:lantibiotic immunity ABC transporter MutE/EpiE family permease subunit [Alicyclobacillus sendaiensis]
MNAAFTAEWMKYRRTLTPWFIACWSLLLVLTDAVLMPQSRTWHAAWMNTFNLWSVFGLPLCVTILAALSTSYERRANSWSVLCARVVRPRVLYISKWAVLAAQLLVATVVYAVLVMLIYYLLWNPHGSLAVGQLIDGIALAWIAALPQLAIMLWVASRVGIGITVCIGLVGLVVGVVAAEKPYWVVIPWAWAGRMLMPVFGFQINGLPLSPGSPFWNHDVIPIGIILSIVAAALFIVMGAIWFDRREVR